MAEKDKFEIILEAYIKMKNNQMPMHKTKSCPNEVILSGYIDSLLTEHEEKIVFEHVSKCLHCLETIVSTRRSKELSGLSDFEDLPKSAVDNAKELPKRYKKFSLEIFLRKNIWLIFAIICFILSFTFKRYFIQFLAATLILSIKWVFDTGSTRTLIMVYNAWKKRDFESLDDTLGNFRDRENLRKDKL